MSNLTLDKQVLIARGKRLREARKARGISAKQLADIQGISEVTVRAHEIAQNGFSIEQAQRYASALDVPLAHLLMGEGDLPPGVAKVASSSPVQMTADGRGNARLQIDKTVPMSVAIKILALLEGGQ